MIAVGVSGGGLASIALTVDPPPGLAAVISFAGGLVAGKARCRRYAQRERRSGPCRGLHRRSARASRTPMLWVYAANDSFFRPDLAHGLSEAFTAGGGRAKLIDAPAFGSDGHFLFSAGAAIWPRWSMISCASGISGLRDLLPPPALPALPPPPRLAEQGPCRVRGLSRRGPAQGVRGVAQGRFRLLERNAIA